MRISASAFFVRTLLGFPLLLVAACEGDGAGPRADEAISQETFVEAYFQLRSEALGSPGEEITLGARDRILADLGVTDEDLLQFVEVWGDNGEMMQGIWETVDSLMRESRRERAEDPSLEGYDAPRRGAAGARGGEGDRPTGRGGAGDGRGVGG